MSARQNFEEILQHLTNKPKSLERYFSLLNVMVGYLCEVCWSELKCFYECAGKVESHPGRWVSSHDSQAKVLQLS